MEPIEDQLSKKLTRVITDELARRFEPIARREQEQQVKGVQKGEGSILDQFIAATNKSTNPDNFLRETARILPEKPRTGLSGRFKPRR